MPVAAPYREPPPTAAEASARPFSQRLVAGLAVVALGGMLASPVIALAMQPFSIVATLVAGVLAAGTGVTYARMCFGR